MIVDSPRTYHEVSHLQNQVDYLFIYIESMLAMQKPLEDVLDVVLSGTTVLF